MVEQHRKARLCGNHDQVRLLANKRKSLLTRDENEYFNKLADDAETASKCGNSASLYRITRQLTGKQDSTTHPVVAADGSPLDSPEEQLNRWREHFQALYNRPPPVPDPILAEEAVRAVPDPSVDTSPPSESEVKDSIKNLKMGKAHGACGIPPELLRYGGPAVVKWLCTMFQKVWFSKQLPKIWLEGTILPLWKSKGSRADCSTYRGITLLSIPAKVFARVLLVRIRNHLLSKQRPEQSGFTPGRSTMDRILALRLLAERRREYRQPLFVAYVDLKAAFDSLDRESLWKILLVLGTPVGIVDLLRALYTNTPSRVQVNGKLSEPFSIVSGVRQGCILAPTLFNTAVDRTLRQTVEARGIGTTFADNFPLLTDLDFADDAALLAESFDMFSEILETFSNAASKLGLQVSWPKTKIQSLSPWIAPPASLSVPPNKVETVESFTYLGSVVNQNCSSAADILRRIALASSVLGRLTKVWNSARISVHTKFRLYNSLVLSVVLYGSATWTLNGELARKLDAFDTTAQRRILNIRWNDFISNKELRRRTLQVPLTTLIRRSRLRLCGHVARWPPGSDTKSLVFSSAPGTWKRPPGRPPGRWMDQVKRDTQMSTADVLEATEDRGKWRNVIRVSTSPGQED